MTPQQIETALQTLIQAATWLDIKPPTPQRPTWLITIDGTTECDQAAAKAVEQAWNTYSRNT